MAKRQSAAQRKSSWPTCKAWPKKIGGNKRGRKRLVKNWHKYK